MLKEHCVHDSFTTPGPYVTTTQPNTTTSSANVKSSTLNTKPEPPNVTTTTVTTSAAVVTVPTKAYATAVTTNGSVPVLPPESTATTESPTTTESGLLSPRHHVQLCVHYFQHHSFIIASLLMCWLQLRVKLTHCLTWPKTCPDLTPVRWLSWCLSWRIFSQAQQSAWRWETPPSTSSAICSALLQRRWPSPPAGNRWIHPAFSNILCSV